MCSFGIYLLLTFYVFPIFTKNIDHLKTPLIIQTTILHQNLFEAIENTNIKIETRDLKVSIQNIPLQNQQ